MAASGSSCMLTAFMPANHAKPRPVASNPATRDMRLGLNLGCMEHRKRIIETAHNGRRAASVNIPRWLPVARGVWRIPPRCSGGARAGGGRMSGARDGGGFLRPGAKSAGAFGVSFERAGPTSAGGGAGHVVGTDVHAASVVGHAPHAAHAPYAAHATLLGTHTAAPLAASIRGLSDLPPGPGDHLPVARYRDKILYTLEQHAVLVLMGETGSGKTTQVRVVGE
eukprot:337520-Chlamydomonas_euryale.AAC.1